MCCCSIESDSVSNSPRKDRICFDAAADFYGSRIGHSACGRAEERRDGTLRVGATPQVIENTLSRFLARYRRQYPGVEVQLVEEGGTDLPRRLIEVT